MHIIAGVYKGQIIETSRGTVRPTMDKVREAIFAMIRDEIPGSTVLDLYAGSGSLGLEALSEGAESCHFVDNSYHSIKAIKKNCQKLNVSEYTYLHQCSVMSYLKNIGNKFNVIFIDPPYKKEYSVKTINAIFENDVLEERGLIVLETGKYENLDELEKRIITTKVYGDTKVTILQ